MSINSKIKRPASVKKIPQSELHPRATKLIKSYSEKYQETLTLESQILASRSNADIVLSHHVEEAYNRVNSKKYTWKKELLIVIGGALFGAFIQGFITEFNSNNTILFTVYIVLGFIGMFLVFLALQRQ